EDSATAGPTPASAMRPLRRRRGFALFCRLEVGFTPSAPGLEVREPRAASPSCLSPSDKKKPFLALRLQAQGSFQYRANDALGIGGLGWWCDCMCEWSGLRGGP